MPYLEPEKLKQLIAITVIVLLGSFIFFSLSGFIPAFLGAIIFYIICSPLMSYLGKKKGLNKTFAAILIILFTFLVILLPIISLTHLLFDKLKLMLSDNTMIFFSIHDANKYVEDLIGYKFLTPENIVLAQKKATSIIPNVLNHTFTILVNIVIMYFVLFYMLYTDVQIKSRVLSFFPYKKENAELFINELRSQTYSNVIGAPLLAVIQALFSMLGFYIFGLEEYFFWGIMCGFLSFIPLVGTALVWVPASLLLLSTSDANWHGIGLLIYGSVVITNVDNVFRFVIQEKIAHVHPLITVFGVIIGLNWFGVPGLIFGPILISYFIIMLRVYRLEYGTVNSRE